MKQGSIIYHNHLFIQIKKAVNTKISRGSQKDIHDGLLNAMMQQMRLEKKDFNRYFDCTMSKEEYIQYLLDNKFIDE